MKKLMFLIMSISTVLFSFAMVQDDINNDALFCEAVARRDIVTAQQLLKSGADVNCKDESERTPLYVACDKDYPDIAKLLLEKGAGVNESDIINQTPLHWAAWKGNCATANVLLEYGANVNRKDSRSVTPLHAACWNDHTAIVKLLLEKGAFVDEIDGIGWTPLYVAVCRDNLSIANVLFEHGANILGKDKNGRTVIECMSNRSFDAKQAIALLMCGAPYPTRPSYQKMLEEEDFERELEGSSLFYQHYFRALIKGNTKGALAALAQAKGNEINQGTPSMNGLAALHWAVLQNNREVLEVLIKISNIKRNKNLRTLAYKIPLVSWYVRNPVDINCRDDQGRTPLMWAARLGYTHIYKDLKKAGADVTLVDKKGKMAINYAADYRNIDIIREMIINGTLSAK